MMSQRLHPPADSFRTSEESRDPLVAAAPAPPLLDVHVPCDSELFIFGVALLY